MLSEAVKEIFERASPKDDVVLIVSVGERPRFSDIERFKDRRARRQFVDDFYRSAKEPVFAQVKPMQSLGLRIIDPLEGTPQMVIAAPAFLWRDVFGNPDSIFQNPQVVLSPNEPTIGLP